MVGRGKGEGRWGISWGQEGDCWVKLKKFMLVRIWFELYLYMYVFEMKMERWGKGGRRGWGDFEHTVHRVPL